VQDTAFGQYSQLTAYLDGRGVPSVEEAMREIRLQPIQRPYRELVSPALLRRLLDVRASGPGPSVTIEAELLSEVETRLRDFLEEARRFDGDGVEIDTAVRTGTTHLGGLMGLLQAAGNGRGSMEPASEAEPGSRLASDVPGALDASASTRRANGASAQSTPQRGATPAEQARGLSFALAADLLRDRPEAQAALLVWALTRPLGIVVDPDQPTEQSRALYDEWLLGAVAERTLAAGGLDDGAAMVGAALTRVLLAHEGALAETNGQGPRRVLERLLRDGDVRDFLGVNRHRDVLWFSQERFDALVAGLLATAIALLTAPAPAAEPPAAEAAAEKPSATESPPKESIPDGSANLAAAHALARAFRDAEGASNYQLERLLNLLPTSPVR
jgi:hypothetical protein